MKLRLTPLNIVAALSLVVLVSVLVDTSLLLPRGMEAYGKLVIALCILVFFVSFLTDQIFRKFIPNLTRLWLIQLVMLVLTVIFMVILKVSFLG